MRNIRNGSLFQFILNYTYIVYTACHALIPKKKWIIHQWFMFYFVLAPLFCLLPCVCCLKANFISVYFTSSFDFISPAACHTRPSTSTPPVADTFLYFHLSERYSKTRLPLFLFLGSLRIGRVLFAPLDVFIFSEKDQFQFHIGLLSNIYI